MAEMIQPQRIQDHQLKQERKFGIQKLLEKMIPNLSSQKGDKYRI